MKKHKIKFNLIFTIFIWLISLAFIGFIIYADILPMKYLLIAVAFFIVWLIVITLFLNKFKKKALKITGYIMSAIIFLLMILVFHYLNSTLDFFKTFGKNKYKEENFLVLVLEDSSYQTINDLNNEKIGYVDSELNSIKVALTKLDSIINYERVEAEDYQDLIDDLFSFEIEAFIIEESYKTVLDENSDYEDKVRVLYTITIKTEISEFSKEVDVTKDSFAIYITGIDTYGTISSVARSDVNIVAVVNPTTKQILLLSIPRDYYVQINGTTGYKDKLTHVGVYGVEKSVATIEDLLEVDINYYLRVNFTSLIKLVDTLDGVDVYSKYSFTSSPTNGSFHFAKGFNHMNGEQALAFSRERMNLPTGDRARGENQQAVINGIFNKAISGTILTKYNSILTSLNGTFQTNINDKDISKLIKMQLGDMAKWTITSYSLDGSDSNDYTYSYPREKLYVMVPYEETLTEAISLIDKVIAGDKLKSSYDDVNGNVYNPNKVNPKPSNPTPETPIKSDNNYLASITFNPEYILNFSKDVQLYNMEVDNVVDQIMISAATEDSKARVTGTGIQLLGIGTNTVTLVVTAEDGSTRTYTLNIIRKEAIIDPIDPEDPIDPDPGIGTNPGNPENNPA